MSQEIREILDKFAKQCFDKGMSVMEKNIDEHGQFKEKHLTVYMTDERIQAHSAIISAIFEKMPEIKIGVSGLMTPEEQNWNDGYATGFNSALTEMRENLKIC